MIDDEPSSDFLVRCEHCAPPPGRLAARYKWMDRQGVWVPVAVRGVTNVAVTTLRGNEADDWWSISVDDDEALEYPAWLRRPKDAPALREHHEISCGTRGCNNRAKADLARLELILTVLERSAANASKPGHSDWVYEFAELVTVGRRGITVTLAGLRAALSLGNREFPRRMGW